MISASCSKSGVGGINLFQSEFSHKCRASSMWNSIKFRAAIYFVHLAPKDAQA